jgi:acetyltransferase-like isoleucine patch superfamily enzyme
MIAKIKWYLRKFLVRELAKLIGDVNEKYERSEWRKIITQFNFLGSNVSIQYPYFISGANFICIGANFTVAHNLRLEAITNYMGEKFTPTIYIGNNVSIESNCHIGAINKIVIEDGVMIASNVYISDHFHGHIIKEELTCPPAERLLSSKGPVIISKNVWIGDSVCILPNVTIGENTIIGANSVVTKSVPPNSVVAGVPATIIRMLN